MRIICKKNNGSQFESGHDQMGITPFSRLDIELGKTYFVLAIQVYDGAVDYFIIDENNLPEWYPKDCFDVVDNKIPSNWKFADHNDRNSGINALLGYSDMINDPDHHDAVYERDPNLIHYIRRLAIEMEEAENENSPHV